MGMFDDIKVCVDLPLPKDLIDVGIEWKNYTFQTKDLDNCLRDYWISKEGKLFERVVTRDYIPYTKEERARANNKPWALWKEVIEKEVKDVELNYHGTITFYTYEEYPIKENDEPKDFWVEFVAYFVYGKLDKIELKNFRFETSLKQRNDEIEKQRLEQASKPWNKFKKQASKWGWIQFWQFVSKCCSNWIKHLESIRMSICRNLL